MMREKNTDTDVIELSLPHIMPWRTLIKARTTARYARNPCHHVVDGDVVHTDLSTGRIQLHRGFRCSKDIVLRNASRTWRRWSCENGHEYLVLK